MEIHLLIENKKKLKNFAFFLSVRKNLKKSNFKKDPVHSSISRSVIDSENLAF